MERRPVEVPLQGSPRVKLWMLFGRLNSATQVTPSWNRCVAVVASVHRSLLPLDEGGESQGAMTACPKECQGLGGNVQ